ncbi:MAG: anthranilate synthase component I [Candidatus Bathyarchaeota archaeon]
MFGLSKHSEHPMLVKFKRKTSPVNLFTKIFEHYDYIYILESVEGPKKLAEYSFIGFDPYIVLKIKDGKAEIYNKVQEEKTFLEVKDPLHTLRRIIGKLTVTLNNFRFLGGGVGYISYDAVRYWEKLPNLATDDLGFPDIEMAIFLDGIIFNHKKKETFYYYLNRNRLAELLAVIDEKSNVEPLQHSDLKVNITKKDFEKNVAKAKEYITAGDIFQVVLSKRYEFKFHGSLIPFYKVLRKINPSPYMYFLKMGPRQIVGSSPEMLVRVENGWIESFPIAGTRPRVKDAVKNRALRRELLLDPKERAEHVMLVDLARNDVGKVSEFGTVSVPEFMKVYQYSHVQHIVSRVTGKLRNGCDSYDTLKAVFPAGTVSGAPKVRAMEIIEECERVRRGPYAGAVGYFSFNGNADFAITIRTLIACKDYAYIQTGAGIVADSDPEKEWFETEHKAEALFKALQLAKEDEVS